jgi:hypothetical protein
MSAVSHSRGHQIYFDGSDWRYSDNNALLSSETRLCIRCGKLPTDECQLKHFCWVIIGAETGSRKGRITPERKWIENIVNSCREHNVPVFLKNSLAEIWGGPLIQEYPWEQG